GPDAQGGRELGRARGPARPGRPGTRVTRRTGEPVLEDAEPPALLEGSVPGSFAQLDRLIELLGTRRKASGGNLWGSSQALVLALLAREMEVPWLATTSTDAEAQAFTEDLAAFGAAAEWLPAREETSTAGARPDAETLRLRLRVAQRLAGPPERR